MHYSGRTKWQRNGNFEFFFESSASFGCVSIIKFINCNRNDPINLKMCEFIACENIHINTYAMYCALK